MGELELKKLLEDVEKAGLSGNLLDEAKRLVKIDFRKLRMGDKGEKEKFEMIVELSRAFARKILEWLGREPLDDSKPPTEEDWKQWNEELDRICREEERIRKDGYVVRYLEIFGRLAHALIAWELYDEGIKLATTIPWFHGEELKIHARFILPKEELEELEMEMEDVVYGDPEEILKERENIYVSDLEISVTRTALMEEIGDEVRGDGEKALEAVLRNKHVLSLWDKVIIANRAKIGRRDLAEKIYPNLEEAKTIKYMIPYHA